MPRTPAERPSHERYGERVPSSAQPVPRTRSRSRFWSLTAGGAILTVVALAAVAWVLLGRGADPDSATSRPSPETTGVADIKTTKAALADGAELVDVRTPEEYAAGHLAGAANIDLSADDFDERIAALDLEADHVVYCASGRRADEAITAMRSAGFTGVLVNAGGFEDLADAGLNTTTR